MRNVTPKQVQQVLTARLALKEPEFRLRRYGPFINGSVISPSFRGKRDRQRLTMIWDALKSEWGEEAERVVGMLIAYTPQEWHMDDDPMMVRKPKAAKVGEPSRQKLTKNRF